MGSARKTVIGGLVLLALPLFAAATSAPARAQYVAAPDVVVFCEPTLRHAVADVGALWRRQTGVPVHIFTSPTALLLEQVSHHIRSDLMIGEGEAAAAVAVQRNLIKAETRFDAWRNRLVVAELATAPRRLVSASQGNLATLMSTGPIAIVDAPAAAGVDSRKALEALGLWDGVQSRSVGVIGTADASFLLAHGTVRLAMVYATDVAANREFSVAATLADDAYPPILYWVAQTHNALSPETGKFASFLRQPQAQERLRADGLEVLP